MAQGKLESWRQDYLLAKALEGLSPRTLDDYDTYTEKLTRYLESNNLPFATASLRQYPSSLEVSVVTLGIRIKVIRTYSRWLAQEGYLEVDAMAAVPNPKTPLVFPRIIDDEDLRKLINAAKRKPRDLALVLMLIDTGIRASECCHLMLEEVDIQNRSALIRNGKGAKDRYVFFSELTARALRRYYTVRPEYALSGNLFIG